MRDKLHAYLEARPAGATPRELLDLIFTQPGSDPEFGPRFLQAMLGTDGRFVWRAADGTWSLRIHDLLQQPLRDTHVVVVDLETTGLSARPTAIVEIGAARVRDGRVVAEFEQLINPGVWLPPFITQLTGITDAMLADQPPISAVWPQFLQFIGADVLVAHNAAFDLSFLDAAAMAYGGQPLPNPHLCTLKLARRLVRESRRRGLDALAGLFGIPQYDRHRALGDARITVEVFFHLVERLAARGVVRLDQALSFQEQARDGRPFVCMLPRDKVEQLPPTPGIYRFFDAQGRLLYIGKAKSLRHRVGSYLHNAAGHSNKTFDLIRHSHEVRVQHTGSELEAALEEAAAIRNEHPPYNRLAQHFPQIAFLKLTVGDAYPRLAITKRLGAGRARYIGPFRHRAEARRVLELLTRLYRLRTCAGPLRPDAAATPCMQGDVGACSAPCAARVDAAEYGRQVDSCVTLLNGDVSGTLDAMIQRRDELARLTHFEAAAKTQRDIDLLQRVHRRQKTLGWITAQQHFLILQPAAGRRVVLAYLVWRGRLVLRARLSDAAEIGALAEKMRLTIVTGDSRIQRDNVDGTTILAAWLRDRGETDGFVFRIAPASRDANAAVETLAQWPATQMAEWRAACASMLGPSADERESSSAPQPHCERQHQEE